MENIIAENRQFKILFIAGSFYPSQIGGPCNSFYWLAKALGKSNIDVTVMATNTGIVDGIVVFDKWIKTEFGRVIYIKTNNNNFSIKYITTSLKKIKSVHLVHLNSIFSFSSFIIGLSAIICKKPIIWSPRGELSPEALKYKKVVKKIMLFFLNFFKKKILFHTTSRLESNDAKAVFGYDVNFLQLPNFMELPSIEAQVKEKYFIYLGRIHPIKAIDNLINACKISKRFNDSSFQLLIVGDNNNDYGLMLKNLVIKNNLNEKIVFVPHVSEIKLKNKLFAQAVFSFLPSHSENFGNVVIESLSNGTPVVASFGSPWQILEDKKAGFWVSNKPEELACIIDKIISMTMQEIHIYSINARSLACDEFDIYSNIFQWINGYLHHFNSHGKNLF